MPVNPLVIGANRRINNSFPTSVLMKKQIYETIIPVNRSLSEISLFIYTALLFLKKWRCIKSDTAPYYIHSVSDLNPNSSLTPEEN
jgi:hypothetical protein